jgi:hypothetical protein
MTFHQAYGLDADEGYPALIVCFEMTPTAGQRQLHEYCLLQHDDRASNFADMQS